MPKAKKAEKAGSPRKAKPAKARSAPSAERKLAELQERFRDQQRRIQSIEGRLATRIKREEIILGAIGLEPAKLKAGDKGTIGELQRILLKNEELLLSSNKRVESILTALKNHREVLIKLNKRVYKEGDPRQEVRDRAGEVRRRDSLQEEEGHTGVSVVLIRRNSRRRRLQNSYYTTGAMLPWRAEPRAGEG